MKTISFPKGMSVLSQTGNWLTTAAHVPYLIDTISFDSHGRITSVVHLLDDQLISFDTSLHSGAFPLPFTLGA